MIFSKPATKCKRKPCQWVYTFGFTLQLSRLRMVQAMSSLGTCFSTFLDIYIQRDLDKRRLSQRKEAQETLSTIWFMKFQNGLKFARNYIIQTNLFSGDPNMGLTLEVGGTGIDGRFNGLQKKRTTDFLHTLEKTWGPSPETKNLTVSFTHQDFLRTSRSMQQRFLLIHLQSSMRMMMFMKVYMGAMIYSNLLAVYLLHRTGKENAVSSELEQNPC